MFFPRHNQGKQRFFSLRTLLGSVNPRERRSARSGEERRGAARSGAERRGAAGSGGERRGAAGSGGDVTTSACSR